MAMAPTPRPGYLGAGCTEACSRQRVRPYAVLHDAASHEDYGYRQALASLCPPTVRTGILTVRFSDHAVLVDGVGAIMATPAEWQILETLATRIGEVVSRTEIAARVYPPGWMLTPTAATHSISVNLSRLRSRLGPAASLVQTVQSHGVMLANVPVGQVVVPLPPGNRHTGRWATHYDRCIDCGRSERAHNSHGRCSRCSNIARRQEALR